MDRPDLKKVLSDVPKLLEQIEKVLAQGQELSSRGRLVVAVAVDMNGAAATFDQLVKFKIFDEAMGHAFARIIEARTHLDVAMRALTEPEHEVPDPKQRG